MAVEAVPVVVAVVPPGAAAEVGVVGVAAAARRAVRRPSLYVQPFLFIPDMTSPSLLLANSVLPSRSDTATPECSSLAESRMT